jgi:anti-sigma B factor antagonist
MTSLALPSEPEVRVARVPGEIAVISLLGEHDIATVWEVRNAIALALEQGTHLVVDLSETEFIDSSIAHALVDSEQFASEQGLRLSLQLQTHDSVKRLLEISGLDALPIYGTRAEAIDAVRQTPNRMTELFSCRNRQPNHHSGKEGKMAVLLALIILLVLFGVIGGLAISKFLFFVLIVAALLALIGFFTRTA